MRISHEAPLSIIRKVMVMTDYDYALVHLFEELPEYFKYFKQAVERGRYVILDNSIFELGEAFDAVKYAEWITKLTPSAYIVPDALEQKATTIENFSSWLERYSALPGLKIGVVQGRDYNEIIECYQYMQKRADIIAISFDYSYYEKQFPNELTKYHSWMRGRQQLITQMRDEQIINTKKPHHLLGCGLPQEFAYYREGFDFIDTLDTSNPVVHGMKGIKYSDLDANGTFGLSSKESVKLFELMEEPVENEADVVYNIHKFRDNVCG
jgi:hypothetical protein